MNADAGRRLRAFVERHRAPGTWHEFAAAVGVSKAALFAWFSGREPSLASITELAKVLGVKRWEVLRAMDGD